MNTINIYLRTSGSVAELQKDFAMFVNSYQNKLIDVFVPKSILYSNQGNTYGNTVKIAGLSTAPNGSQVTSDSFYLDYLRDETKDNIEYSVYERVLPKELTVYAGNTIITTNVISVDNTNPSSPVILQVVTTQTCTLVVQNSSYIGDSATMTPSQYEQVTSRITENETDIVDLQNRMTTAETNITDNTQDISTNTQDIADIKQIIGTGENYVGTMTGATLPTTQQLATFVYNNTSPSRQPKGGDTIIFILQISGQTDKNYKYIYNGTIWGRYEIPPTEVAGNGSLGIVQGTYNIGSANNTLIDVANGQILNIYIKDNSNTYRNIREYVNTDNTTLANILNGTTSIGYAVRALQDGLGRVINDTYMTIGSGVTKSYVTDYAMPKIFNNIYYLAKEDNTLKYISTYPTGTGSIASVNVSSVGETLLASSTMNIADFFNMDIDENAKFEFSNKNSYQHGFYLSSSINTTVKFKIVVTINGFKNNDLTANDYTANIELTEDKDLTANQIYKIALGENLNYLLNDTINCTKNNNIKFAFYVVTESSSATTYTIYSNEAYPSRMFVNTQVLTIHEQSGMLGESPVIDGNGSVANNQLIFTLDAESLSRNTECEFILNLPASVAEPAETTEVKFILNGQDVRVITPYNFESGNAILKNFRQLDRMSDPVNGITWTCKGFVKIDAGDNVSVILDMDNLSDFADKDYVTEQNAKVHQIDMPAILNGNAIKAYLDDTLSDFTFENAGFYKFHITLPISLLNNDLANNLVIELYDKPIAQSSTANKIVINNIFHISNITSATVGDMCSLQNYDINTGVEWIFNARYSQFIDSGVTYRTIYTSDVVRESNPSMTGADLYVNIVNNSLKTGTSVYCLTDYTNGTISYTAGVMYKITGEVIDNELIIDAQAQHDPTREDISHKTSNIDVTQPSATNYPNELAIINFAESQISNPNLLINGDFRVNQRGQTTYTGAIYGVDRWKATQGNTVVTVLNNGVRINTTTAGWFGQNIEIPFSAIAGKTLTISAKIDGNIYSATGTIPNTVPTSQTNMINKNASGATYLVLTYLTNGNINCHIYIPQDTTIEIEYFKLEIGEVATTFSPRPYAEELALCQRYYQRYNFRLNMPLPFGVARNSNTISINFMIPKLRTLPTFGTNGTIKILNSPSTTNLSLIYNQYFDGCMRLFTNTSVTEGMCYALAGEMDGYYEFDAEIY